MNAETWSELKSIASEIGLSGLVDILAMAALLYLALSWLRGIRRVLRGAIVLVVAYVAARVFHLDLSASALEVTFVVVVLAAIVTFRDEVRQAIERIAVFYRISTPRPSAELTLGHTLFHLAAERVGALVVVEGHDRIDDLIDGGTELDGLPSDRLIKSLFDPHSAGHDGATLLRAGRIVRFACHLPLSTNFDQLKSHGTRHAAALGLSERCDAVAIVVSEERGVVSMARAGTLSAITSAQELDTIVAGVTAKSGRAEPDDRARSSRLPTASAALVISTLLWAVLVYGTRPTQRTYDVDVDYADLAGELRVASVSPEHVQVTLTGPRREFFFVDAPSIRVSVPLASAREGRLSHNLSSTDVAAPSGLNVKAIRPIQVVVLVGKK